MSLNGARRCPAGAGRPLGLASMPAAIACGTAQAGIQAHAQSPELRADLVAGPDRPGHPQRYRRIRSKRVAAIDRGQCPGYGAKCASSRRLHPRRPQVLAHDTAGERAGGHILSDPRSCSTSDPRGTAGPVCCPPTRRLDGWTFWSGLC